MNDNEGAPPLVTSVDRLIQTVEANTAQFADLRHTVTGVEQLSETWESRLFWNRLSAWVGIAAAVVAIVVAVVATHELAAYKADNQAARVASCEQFNMQAAAGRAADKANIRVLTAQAGPATDPAHIRAFLAQYDASVDRGHPTRDCSPAGIAKYLSGTTTTEGK